METLKIIVKGCGDCPCWNAHTGRCTLASGNFMPKNWHNTRESIETCPLKTVEIALTHENKSYSSGYEYSQ